MSSEVKISGPVNLIFQPQAIAYVLDMLANCPFKMANPIISDIMVQLKIQETKNEQKVGGGISGSDAGASDRVRPIRSKELQRADRLGLDSSDAGQGDDSAAGAVGKDQ